MPPKILLNIKSLSFFSIFQFNMNNDYNHENWSCHIATTKAEMTMIVQGKEEFTLIHHPVKVSLI